MHESVYTLVDDIWMLIQRSLIDLALTHRHGRTTRYDWKRVQSTNLILLSMRRINIINQKTSQGHRAFVEKMDEWSQLVNKAVLCTKGCDTSGIQCLLDELTLFKRSLSIYVCESAWHWIL